VLLAPMSAGAKCTGKAGAPVVAIPAGQDAEGLPFGVTVFAAPGDDERVLEAAGRSRRWWATGWRPYWAERGVSLASTLGGAIGNSSGNEAAAGLRRRS